MCIYYVQSEHQLVSQRGGGHTHLRFTNCGEKSIRKSYIHSFIHYAIIDVTVVEKAITCDNIPENHTNQK